jgi:hypothetical protein
VIEPFKRTQVVCEGLFDAMLEMGSADATPIRIMLVNATAAKINSVDFVRIFFSPFY